VNASVRASRYDGAIRVDVTDPRDDDLILAGRDQLAVVTGDGDRLGFTRGHNTPDDEGMAGTRFDPQPR